MAWCTPAAYSYGKLCSSLSRALHQYKLSLESFYNTHGFTQIKYVNCLPPSLVQNHLLILQGSLLLLPCTELLFCSLHKWSARLGSYNARSLSAELGNKTPFFSEIPGVASAGVCWQWEKVKAKYHTAIRPLGMGTLQQLALTDIARHTTKYGGVSVGLHLKHKNFMFWLKYIINALKTEKQQLKNALKDRAVSCEAILKVIHLNL